jgi:hypothetical protein
MQSCSNELSYKWKMIEHRLLCEKGSLYLEDLKAEYVLFMITLSHGP